MTVPFTKDVVKDAPNVNPDEGHLSPEEEQRLYQHYGVGDTTRAADTDLDATTGTRTGYDTTRAGGMDTGDRGDTSGPDTDNAMTRSEEQLRVGTQTQETGRARLRKYVTTEQEQVTVPVTREEVRVEREPITEANRGEAMSGPDISEEEHEVTLHEERPVVATEAVPVERVRVDVDTVTEQQQVSESVRKEQIELDTDEVDRNR